MRRKIECVVCLVVIAIFMFACRQQARSLTFLNWDDYTGAGVKEGFTKATGVTVTEKNYGTNEELIGLLERSHADVVVPSTYAVDILSQQGKLGRVDWSKLRNSGVVPASYRAMPEAVSCIPYTWSALSIFYDTSKVKDTVGLDLLFDPNKRKPFAGHILLLDDRRAMLGLALRYLGYSVNTTNAAEIDQATALLIEVKKDTMLFASGLLVDRISNTPGIWLGVSWSGDARWAAAKRSNIGVTLPSESIVYVDWACLTKDANEQATGFLDHLLAPASAVAVAETTHYCPVNDAVEPIAKGFVQQLVREWKNSSSRMNPEMIQDTGPTGTRMYEAAWLRIKQ